MVVDEAAMLGTEVSVELFNVIKTTGAKLVLVGDDRQLSSVECGGTFRTLTERYESVELKKLISYIFPDLSVFSISYAKI